MPEPPPAPPTRRLAALLLALLTLGVSGFSVLNRVQLASFGGLTDEWHMLGGNLAVSGVLGLGQEPWILRAPGYPAFIALALSVGGTPRAASMSYLMRTEVLVFAAQCLVLAAATTILFFWLSDWLGLPLAVAAALVFGLNPLNLTSVGLLHYSLLHQLGLIAGTWALQRVMGTSPRIVPLLATGALWGLVTLVRPVSLLLPVFALVGFLARERGTWRSAVRATALFALGMVLTIAPWTARNWVVSGRFVAVNLQAGVALWAPTVKPLPLDPEHYVWFELYPEMMRLYTRVTGQETYDLLTFVRFLPELDAAHRREAIANIRRQPLVYVRNVARSLYTVTFQTNTGLPRAFRFLQREPGLARAHWFQRGLPQPFGGQGLAMALRGLFGILAALSVVGLVLAARRRDRDVLAPMLVGACVVLAHALTHMDLMYFYLRVPFLVIFAFYALHRLVPRGPNLILGGRRIPAGLAAGFVLAVASLALTAWVLAV